MRIEDQLAEKPERSAIDILREAIASQQKAVHEGFEMMSELSKRSGGSAVTVDELLEAYAYLMEISGAGAIAAAALLRHLEDLGRLS